MKEQSGPHKAESVGQAVHNVPDVWMDGSRMNFYQHLFVLGNRLFHLLQFKNIRWSVSCV